MKLLDCEDRDREREREIERERERERESNRQGFVVIRLPWSELWQKFFSGPLHCWDSSSSSSSR